MNNIINTVGKHAFCVVAALVMTITASAATEVTYVSDSSYYKSSDGLFFTIDMDSGTATLVNSWYPNIYTAGSTYTLLTDIDVPDSISYNNKRYAVTEIGSLCFYQCGKLKKVTLPATITALRRSCFNRDSLLTSVEFAEGSRLELLDSMCFYLCPRLGSINLDDCSHLKTIEYGSFASDSALTTITLPDSLETIYTKAFMGCTSLEKVTFGDNSQLASIDSAVFDKCISLSSINLDRCSRLKTIGERCFSNNSALTTITLPDSLETIYTKVFYGCTSLTSVTFGNNSQLTSIDSDVFYECTGLSSINLECCSRLKTIGEMSFCYNSSLTTITLPDSVETIYTKAFYRCSSLEKVTFGDNSQLASIDSLVFYRCTNLSSINLDCCSRLSTIGDRCFRNDSALASIVLPASVSEIGEGVFYECAALESVTFGEGSRMKAISDYAFCKTVLTSIEIPDSVTSIGYGAFSRCRFTTLDIPAAVTSIGQLAFNACDSMKAITFRADGLTTYGTSAFANCSSDLKIYVQPYSLSSYTTGWSSYADLMRPFYELTIADGIGAATLCLPFRSTIPDGVRLYTLNGLNADSTRVCGDEVSDTLIADTPVYVSAGDTGATYTFYGTSADDVSAASTTATNGWMTGVYTRTAVPAGSFVLQNQESNGVSFYKVEQDNSIYVNAYRAWLTLSDAAAAILNSLDFGDDDNDDTTGLTSLTTGVSSSTGRSGVYNLHGMRVADSMTSDGSSLPRGIYIIDGKKVTVR